jgi:hypothetical protein
MEITGSFMVDPDNAWCRITNTTGAFTADHDQTRATGGASGSTTHPARANFTASNSWTGATSSVGGGAAHNHGNTGSTSNLPPYKVVYAWERTA